jgi:hypothetical protein
MNAGGSPGSLPRSSAAAVIGMVANSLYPPAIVNPYSVQTPSSIVTFVTVRYFRLPTIPKSYLRNRLKINRLADDLN